MIPTETLKKEEALVITYQTTGCNKAFGELYERLYGQLFDYVYKIVSNSDDAFDITQEAFIQAANQIHQLRVPITFRFWLFQIAKHMCLKNYKKAAKIVIDRYEVDNIDQDYSAQEAIDKDELLEKMACILTTLSKEEQDILTAKYFEGKSIKQIMETTNLGSSAIKMKLMRARTKVANQMGIS